jgi:hypothetical protein
LEPAPSFADDSASVDADGDGLDDIRWATNYHWLSREDGTFELVDNRD